MPPFAVEIPFFKSNEPGPAIFQWEAASGRILCASLAQSGLKRNGRKAKCFINLNVTERGLYTEVVNLLCQHIFQAGQSRDALIDSVSAPRAVAGLRKKAGGKSGHYRAVCLLKKRDGGSERSAGQIVPQKTDRLFRKVRVKRWGKSPPRRG